MSYFYPSFHHLLRLTSLIDSNSSIEIIVIFRPMRKTPCRANLTQFSKQKSRFASHIVIDKRFCLKSLKGKHSAYNLYKGVDISRAKWVHIYVKQVPSCDKGQRENGFPLSKGVKEHLRNQISPKLIWSGNADIQNSPYFIEVHEKFGPSLQNVFDRLNSGPKERQLLHLLFQMIKLIQKMYSLRLVNGQLDPNSIIFDPNPKKNELYLLNCFTIKKKNTQNQPIFTKYCSRGAHLGRNIGVKDDLESVCYILIDLFTGGHFLQDKMPYEYQEYKLSLKIEEFAEGLPKVFIDFYNYVINLNCSDEINFFYWKTYLSRVLAPEVVAQPYTFLLVKNGGNRHLTQYTKKTMDQDDQIEDMMEICEDDELGLEIHVQKVSRDMSIKLIFKQDAFKANY